MGLASALFILLWARLGSAEDVQKPMQAMRYNTIFDKTQHGLGQSILSISEGLDTFLSADRVVNEGNESRGYLSLTTTVTDGVGTEVQPKFRLKLKLKKTQNRLNLVVDNISDAFRNDQVQETQLQRAQTETQDNGLTTALRYIFTADEKWDVNTNAGIKIRFPLDPFVSFRARRNYGFWDWKLALTQNFFWFYTQGLGEVSRADLSYVLGPKLLFQFANSASWLKDEDFFRFSHSLGLYQTLRAGRALAYTAGASGISDPVVHVETYSLAVSYRQNIFRKWLYLDVIPGLSFPKENNFSGVPSIAFRIESVFGDADPNL